MTHMRIFYTLICACCCQVVAAEKLEMLSNVDMFDVGLALINDDDYYDIYTINHNFAESYLLNEKQSFKLVKQIGLSQTNELPAYEPVGKSPEFKKGLNVFSPNRKSMMLYCNECSKGTSGHIIVPIPLKEVHTVAIKHQHQATISSAMVEDNGAFFAKLTFTLQPSGLIVLEPLFPDLVFKFSTDLPPNEVFVGHASTNPKQSTFTYNTQDNHSSSWALVDDDDLTDVFMSTGGLRARIKDFSPKQVIPEQIYSYDPQQQKFKDSSDQFKFQHAKCRTYKSIWIDFENDGDLDLYQGCLNSSNKLHIQNGLGTGEFTEVAAKYKLNLRQSDEFKWFDYNGDGLLDLLAIGQNRFKVMTHLRRKNQSFFRTQFVSEALGKKLNSVTTSIKVADINNNGTPAFFVTTSEQLFIFDVTPDGKVQHVPLSQYKLPKQMSGHVSFADVNLDGWLDLISFNTGIFVNNKAQFELTDMLPELFVKKKRHFKNLIWFDADHNGQWDVINAESYPSKSKGDLTILDYKYRDIKVWDHIELIRNIPNENHWIHVDLIGSPFNKSAVGAKIEIKSSTQTQHRQVMGTEDSFHSQGNYRQYFGVGKAAAVDIKVEWPGGVVQELKQVATKQLLKISHPNKQAQ